MLEGKTKGKASGLVESMKAIPNNVEVRVANMSKLREVNTKNNLSMGKFLLVEKHLDRFADGWWCHQQCLKDPFK